MLPFLRPPLPPLSPVQNLGDWGKRSPSLHTGFRATELLSLNVGDVWHDGKIRTTVTVARRRLKGGRGRRRKAITSRTVPLNDAAVPSGRDRIQDRTP